jgi:hypothetical protein
MLHAARAGVTLRCVDVLRCVETCWDLFVQHAAQLLHAALQLDACATDCFMAAQMSR